MIIIQREGRRKPARLEENKEKLLIHPGVLTQGPLPF